MSDNDIIKALKCCAEHPLCNNCPYLKERGCVNLISNDTLDLINRQKADIERLKAEKDNLIRTYAECQAEVVKEFVERLVYTLCINNEENTEIFDYAYTLETIDNLVKEFMEGKKK